MNICVFCGSSIGNDPIYRQKANELGCAIAMAGHSLVYGGSKIGTMKVLADAVMNCGNTVIGIMPKMIVDKEIAYREITKLIECKTMSERKEIMTEMSDAFIIMPGGFGTIDELFEVLTLTQLSIINKPIILLNTNNYFDKLVEFIEHGTSEGFVAKEHKESICVAEDIEEALSLIKTFKFNHPERWIDTLIKETDSSCGL